MKSFVYLALLVVAVVAFASCNSGGVDGPSGKHTLESITETDIVAMPNAQSLVIEYRSDSKCRVEVGEEAMAWISCDGSGDKANSVVLNIEKNVSGVNRSGLVRIVAKDNPKQFIEYSFTQYTDDSKKIYYTTTDGNLFVPEYEDKFCNGFGVEIKSHTYDGIGIIEFVGDVKVVANFQERYPMICRLKSIYLPEGLTTIADYAFFECKELEEVSLPETLESIGGDAFSCCYKLETITIPNGVKVVNQGAFAECESLVEISLPDSVETIGDRVFQRCPNLTEVKLPNSMTTIPQLFFYNCAKLESIEIPESVESIDMYAFTKCASLKSIELPANLKSIYMCAFEECSALESVSFPSTLELLCGDTFENCVSLVSVKLPDSLKDVGLSEFLGCSQLADFNIPRDLKDITHLMFLGCIGPEELIIPDNTERIGESAFQGCTGIKRVTIGSGVYKIYARAFYECANLAELYCMPTTPPAMSEMALTGCSSELKIYVPSGSVDAYKAAEGWSEYKNSVVGYDF